jgi:hypothetical protein
MLTTHLFPVEEGVPTLVHGGLELTEWGEGECPAGVCLGEPANNGECPGTRAVWIQVLEMKEVYADAELRLKATSYDTWSFLT